MTFTYLFLRDIEKWSKYFKNLAVLTPQDFSSMVGHVSTLCMKGLIVSLYYFQGGQSNPIFSIEDNYYISLLERRTTDTIAPEAPNPISPAQ